MLIMANLNLKGYTFLGTPCTAQGNIRMLAPDLYFRRLHVIIESKIP